MPLTLLTGGVRSGKSSFAVGLGERWNGPVTFIATAPALDDDMAARIERHRAERPASWVTIEEETELEQALRTADSGMVIVDCLTLWVSNLMAGELAESDIALSATAAALVCASRPDPVVVVTNEVGMGVHPPTELGRRYRDVLGRVNQMFAGVADASFLLVAGRALPLHDPATVPWPT